ncbi:gtp-binding protein 1 [Moniliophthora roreri MCA 2997]|uniref:Gtp-binding protein 1 n=1 Tax=Moniliophthora roreri (strain MCA 2997) TaxID=1381753 RepID=V2XCY5_MONRO|nr:gtp-binding protein 1 [Moniliophthora roreri MCA 2997]
MASNKTSLRNFQNEIDEIHNRELAKQRSQATAIINAAKDKDKKHTDAPKVKMKDGDGGTKEKAKDADKEKGKDEMVGHGAEAGAVSTEKDATEMEEKIQELLLNNSPTDRDRARDIIATLITQHHGEYVLRMGAHPPHDKLFAGEITDKSDAVGWRGIERTTEQLEALRARITTAVEEIGGKTSVLFKSKGKHPRISLLLRLPPASVSLTPEVRCAVVGNVDSGKSTTLGVLTRGALDDGRGKARVGLFRHKHEIETGRTSSVGMEILGFDPAGNPILPDTAGSSDPEVIRREKLGWEEISVQAAKIVSFIDLAGHEKYLKTTLYGLTSGAPSCVVLIVGANAGLIGMSKEHLSIALALSVPIVVCITKIDMTPANVKEETVKQVVKILKSPGCRKTPVFVKSGEIAVEVATAFGKDRLCPIFQVSNVTGEGLNYLRIFLNLLPSSEADTDKFAVDQPLEFCITEVWSVPYVGTVVNGIVNSGRVSKGDAVIIGPDSNGNYQTTSIKDMQRKRATVTTAEAGQCVSLALKRVRRATVRKGMVLVHKAEKAETPPPRAVRQFEGQVLILYHNTTLQRNYQAMLHCGAVRQTVRIIGMDHPQGILRTGDRATVQFEFISHPEFVKEGMKLLFREGKTKGLGVITKLL